MRGRMRARESAFVNFRSESELAPILKGIEAACVKLFEAQSFIASLFFANQDIIIIFDETSQNTHLKNADYHFI